MKKQLEKILFSLIMILITFFNCPNIKEQYILFYVLLNIIFLIFICYKIKYHESLKIITNKFDIIIYLFLLSSFVPLIFNNCVSLGSELKYIKLSISCLYTYIFIKNLSLKKEDIIDIIIYSSTIIIIITFDRMFYNIFWNKIKLLNIFQIMYEGTRALSNFNYPNSLCCYTVTLLILCLNRFTNNKNKKIYSIFIYLLLLISLMTQSRACLILFIIIYFFLIHKSKQKKELNKIVLFSLFTSIIYILLSNLIDNNIIKIILLLITTFIIFKSNKIKINSNIIKKSIIICFLVSLFYLCITINISTPTKISESSSFKIVNIKNNQKIKLNFNGEKIDYKIEIIENNNHYIDKKIASDTSNKNKYETKLKITDKVHFVTLKIINKNTKSLYLNKIYINNKEYIVNYKYLPNDVIKLFKFSNLKSIKQRITYYKDSIKIIKQNIFKGNGSNGWKFKYKDIQSYNYTSLEVHSYILDTFISFGLISVILLLIIYIKNIKEFIKKENNNSIFNYCIIFILIHSMFDFDMSFSLMVYILFILISLNTKNKLNYKIKYINIIAILITTIITTFDIINYININKLSNEVNIPVEIKYAKYKNYNKKYYNEITKYEELSIMKNYLSQIKYNNEEKYNLIKKEYLNKLFEFYRNETYYEKEYIESEIVEEIIDQDKNDYVKTFINYKKRNEQINSYNFKYLLMDSLNLEKLYNYSQDKNNKSDIKKLLLNNYNIYKKNKIENSYQKEEMLKIETEFNKIKKRIE